MTYFYNENAAKNKRRAQPYDEQDATLHYCKHFSNLRTLEAISKKTADMIERFRIEKEISLARRKMAHWEKHTNFDIHLVAKVIKLIKQEPAITTTVSQ